MMKIGPLENKSTLPVQGADRKVAGGGSATASTPEPSAKVELSAAASAIANGVSDGSFDAQKVERLSRAIREGHYQINPEAIADQLLANARDLLTRNAE
jgi:negative regulator of flagellin synthesis FlgM